MGFNGNWLAAKNVAFDRLQRKVGFVPIGSESIEHVFEAKHCAGTLPGGWSLCVLGDFEDRLYDDHLLPALSADNDVIMCQALESMMCSEVSLWSGGKRTWIVYHNPQDGDFDHLEFEGTDLPESLERLRQQAIEKRAKDDEVDFMFDVPVLLAEEITGFNYNNALPDGARIFEVELVEVNEGDRVEADRGPWWKFW